VTNQVSSAKLNVPMKKKKKQEKEKERERDQSDRALILSLAFLSPPRKILRVASREKLSRDRGGKSDTESP